MQGVDIVNLLQTSWRYKNVFRGVFPSDRLPNIVNNNIPNAFIINLDTHDKPGSHWVGLYITTFGVAVYMDSFGVGPLLPTIKSFISKNSRALRYNNIVIQSLTSQTCGLYATYFIMKMADGSSLQQFNTEFNPYSPTYNDRRIILLMTSKLLHGVPDGYKSSVF